MNESTNATNAPFSFSALSPHTVSTYFNAHIGIFLISLLFLLAGALTIQIFSVFLRRFFDRTNYDKTVEIFAQRTLIAFLWIVLLLALLSNVGVNVTAFVAGLGVIGFIIGFATRDIFSNLAAGLLLLITKPFKVGDDVEAAGIRGIVEEVNMSFSVLTVEKTQYVAIPNTRIWGAPIKNFSRLTRQVIKKK